MVTPGNRTATCVLQVLYRVIHNSLKYFTKWAYLNGGKDFNMRPTYRNSPSLFVHAARARGICPDAGSEAGPQKTRRCFVGHQDRLT
jgi:hypothetical protein